MEPSPLAHLLARALTSLAACTGVAVASDGTTAQGVATPNARLQNEDELFHVKPSVTAVAAAGISVGGAVSATTTMASGLFKGVSRRMGFAAQAVPKPSDNEVCPTRLVAAVDLHDLMCRVRGRVPWAGGSDCGARANHAGGDP